MRVPDETEMTVPPDANDRVSRPLSSSDHEWDEAPEPIEPLSREEAERLFGPTVSRPPRATPMRVVLAQVLLSVCIAAISGVLSKAPWAAVLSALLGGAICWVPSGVFAAQIRRRAASIGAWMLAEGLKLGLTVAMFIAVALLYRDVRWLPLLVTYVLALKTYWLALAWR